MNPENITTKNGLIYHNNKPVPFPEADYIARAYGYVYAEQLVKRLEIQNKVLKEP